MPETELPPIAPANADAGRAWNGPDGVYWAEHEAVFDASLARYRDAFLAAAGITARDRVLDIGCGNGETTRDAARIATSGSALGLDLSAPMVERARARAEEEGLTNVEFRQGDAQIYPFDPQTFDAAISRTGAMFFADPDAAFANIAGALRPGGRLTLLVWQPLPRNHWIREFAGALAAGREVPTPPPGAPGPFSLADADRARPLLSRAGFSQIVFEDARELMFFGRDAGEAFRFIVGQGFAKNLLGDLDDDARARALEALQATIDAHETPDGVLYPSAVWIITAHS